MARRARFWSSALAFLASSLVLAVPRDSGADEIQLRGGGRISGVVVERTERTITIETGPGQVTLPLSLVERVADTRSAIEVWQERSSALDGRDVRGWATLARWAEAQGLATQARTAWHRVLSADPQNADANAALGRVRLDGTWVEPEQAYRAQGLVPYEGRWVTPAEQEALLRQQEADSAAVRSQHEAEARLREAEARAREAEARAQEAENTQPYDGGIPVYGVGGYAVGGYGGVGSYGCGGYPGCNGSGDADHGRRRDHDARGDDERGRPRPQPTPRPGTAGPRHRGSSLR